MCGTPSCNSCGCHGKEKNWRIKLQPISLQIFGDLSLSVGLIKLLLSQNIIIRFRVKVAIINQLFYA